jgi:hypothetical protein
MAKVVARIELLELDAKIAELEERLRLAHKRAELAEASARHAWELVAWGTRRPTRVDGSDRRPRREQERVG